MNMDHNTAHRRLTTRTGINDAPWLLATGVRLRFLGTGVKRPPGTGRWSSGGPPRRGEELPYERRAAVP
ncbi:hypothetical protein NHX12_011052 [Muraenolepis orangiensis]|uniref:Uncharacterized protein n=1 Tax=Muraenolepis orangiensis TaxID=630683 RepID=A0A9Q0I6T2_9TELE|nr:hypothetical protein NHX12_011052 [Muraenolepis orangiensis]